MTKIQFLLTISPLNHTLRSREWRERSSTEEALDCWTNSPCQHLRKCRQINKESMHTSVRVWRVKWVSIHQLLILNWSAFWSCVVFTSYSAGQRQKLSYEAFPNFVRSLPISWWVSGKTYVLKKVLSSIAWLNLLSSSNKLWQPRKFLRVHTLSQSEKWSFKFGENLEF